MACAFLRVTLHLVALDLLDLEPGLRLLVDDDRLLDLLALREAVLILRHLAVTNLRGRRRRAGARLDVLLLVVLLLTTVVLLSAVAHCVCFFNIIIFFKKLF